MIMEATKQTSGKETKLLYYLLTALGLLFLAIAQDFNWAGICFALALAFNPFAPKGWKKFSLPQKSLLLGQLILAMVFIGVNLYLVVVN